MTQASALVLVVDDEPQMRKFIRASLASNGYRVVEAESLREALTLQSSYNPELVLLDLGLPDGTGVELTKRIRESSHVPIIVISASGREQDKVTALDAGADDYLTKPFAVNELLARMRVTQRYAYREDTPVAPQLFDFGELHIDVKRREVTRAGEPVHLTPTEYKLLVLLAEHAGKVLTHRQILRAVWGPAYATQTHYVRVQMADLRKKIERDPARPKLLMTEPGVGYRLTDRESDSTFMQPEKI